MLYRLLAGYRTAAAPKLVMPLTLQVQIYDMASDSWSLGKNLPYSVGSAATAHIEGYVFLCGGILQSIGEGAPECQGRGPGQGLVMESGREGVSRPPAAAAALLSTPAAHDGPFSINRAAFRR